MNEFDSERLAYILENLGYAKTDNPSLADIILINTCSVREKAENRLFGHLGNFKSLKLKNPDLLLCVGGCTAQSQKEFLIKKFPFIDIIFGTGNINRIPSLIRESTAGVEKICDTGEFPDSFDFLFDFKRQYSFKAFLPIMIGCNNFCSYCIVPHVRGRERSATPGSILNAVKNLSEDGVLEIMLLGQNVNSYGMDLKHDHATYSYNFSKLLSDLSEIKKIKRLRFMTSHPKDFTDDIIEVIKNKDNIMNHIHLPLQAGSDRVLDLMNRKYTRKSYTELYFKIKEKIPDCAITTDIIVGFPGESENDFNETLRLVEELRFNRAFTFIFSPRKGTSAESFVDNIPVSVKKQWFRQLLEIQNSISLSENSRLIGSKFKVLVEGYSTRDNHLEGRLENNIIVNFNGESSLIGKFAIIEITGARSFYLEGRVWQKDNL